MAVQIRMVTAAQIMAGIARKGDHGIAVERQVAQRTVRRVRE